MPRTVKQEPPSAPPRRSSGALVICEGARTSSQLLRGRKRKPRKDDAAAAASDLADAEAARAEDAALREAIAKSLDDLVPADNSMSMDAALAWSRQDWEREQAEQQRRLLDLAQAYAANPPEARRSSSWRTPTTTTCTGLRRHASALDRGQAVGPPAIAASRHRRRTTAATPATTTAATTRVSTAISACRTCFKFRLGRIQIYYEFGLYILNISKFRLSLNVFV
jgi:hypothetical protein